LRRVADGAVVTDSVGLRTTLAEGRIDRRPMFAEIEEDGVVWPDGQRERVDAIVLATGYRPSVDYLRDLGAVDASGVPLHQAGISSTHPGLVYVGLEYQRSYASNTLRGVGEDARAVVEPLVAWARGAPSAVGL
jgi:putative flavoprotein involved in K+ transport